MPAPGILLRTWQRLSSAGSILCYHSLTTAAEPSAGVVNVSLEVFRMTVDTARRAGTIVPLIELIDRHQAGRSTAGLVALTFDDAYESLARHLPSVLRRESLPITVFVATDAARDGRRYWWDRTDDLYGRVGASRWRAFEDELGLPAAYREGQPAEYGPLRPLRQWVLAEHRGRWNPALERAVTRLETDAGYRTPHRSMTFAELDSFAAEPLVDIGVHTVSHPVLPLLSDEEMTREIRDCYDELKQRLPRTLPILAFPYGLFSERAGRVAKAAGMRASLSLSDRSVARGALGPVLPRLAATQDLKAWKLRLRLTGLVDPIVRWRRGWRTDYPELPSPTT